MKTLKIAIVLFIVTFATATVQAQFGKGGGDKPVTKPETGTTAPDTQDPSQETAPAPKPKPASKPDTGDTAPGTTAPQSGNPSQETAPLPTPRPKPAPQPQTVETPKGKKGPSAATIQKAEQNSNGNAFSGKGKGGDKNTMDPVMKEKSQNNDHKVKKDHPNKKSQKAKNYKPKAR